MSRPAGAIQTGKDKDMQKITIDIDSLGIDPKSFRAVVGKLADMVGDQVYFSQVLQVESSEEVLNAVSAVVEGVKKRAEKGT